MAEVKGTYWRRLDNAAKLFSAASNKNDTRVFRFYCELKEEVQEDILQEATERMMEKYPLFLSVMRKGLFWHYLEKSSLHPIVRQEYREPCSMLYVRDKKDLLFEVTYYKKRINVEIFHALTDGTGASEFTKELVETYLSFAHKEDGLEEVAVRRKAVTSAQEDDGFSKYYSKTARRKKEKKQKAYQIHPRRSELGSLQVTEALIPVEQLKEKSRHFGVSMTVFLTAVYLCAIARKMSRRQQEKPVVLMVPVNLRNFFPSESMLNFFSWIEPGYQFGQGHDSFEEVLSSVKEAFEKQLTKENMERKVAEYVSLEVHPLLRLAPLDLKNLCITAGMRTSEKDVTAIFSNMGIVTMPPSYEPYVERFGVYTSTPKTELCMCSYRENVYLGFTSRYDSSEIKENFFQILEETGITVQRIEPDFPEAVRESQRGIKIFKILTFLCIIAIVAAISIDYLTHTSFIHISLLISGVVASVWLSLSVGYFKRHNLLKNAMWQLMLVTVGGFLWDYSTGWRGWSVAYVLPIADLTIQASMVILSKIYYRLAKDYMIYFVMAAGYGVLLPLIFLLTGRVTGTAIPSVLCIACSVIMLAGLLIFKGKEFLEEMEKKFHV